MCDLRTVEPNGIILFSGFPWFNLDEVRRVRHGRVVGHRTAVDHRPPLGHHLRGSASQETTASRTTRPLHTDIGVAGTPVDARGVPAERYFRGELSVQEYLERLCVLGEADHQLRRVFRPTSLLESSVQGG